MSLIKFLAEPVFGFSLIINAGLYLIQAYRLYQKQSANNISLLTFLFFFFVLLVQAMQAYYLQDWIYWLGMYVSLICCGFLIWLIIHYRLKTKRSA